VKDYQKEVSDEVEEDGNAYIKVLEELSKRCKLIEDTANG
jgi:hypothetical protein